MQQSCEVDSRIKEVFGLFKDFRPREEDQKIFSHIREKINLEILELSIDELEEKDAQDLENILGSKEFLHLDEEEKSHKLSGFLKEKLNDRAKGKIQKKILSYIDSLKDFILKEEMNDGSSGSN